LLGTEWHIARRSQGDFPDETTDIWLIDTFGELPLFYALADVCTLGGSFNGAGGHNPLEPAALGKACVLGPNMQNAQALVDCLASANALIQVTTGEDLLKTLTALLHSAAHREHQGTLARQAIAPHQGASLLALRTLQSLETQTTDAKKN
jgi:3-deoxy-D-manno-octulosonic-acid transferase